MRWFSAWLVLFGSKFVVLEAINLAFGDRVTFAGPVHGLIAMIVVLFVMVIAEEIILRMYRRLA